MVMTAHEKYQNFLQQHGVMRNALSPNNNHLITYRDKKCLAKHVGLVHTIYAEIKPISNEWDIGNGAGGAIRIEFHSDKTSRLI